MMPRRLFMPTLLLAARVSSFRPAASTIARRRRAHHVLKMSTSSNSNADGDGSTPTRIFCYGDSLTAGTSPPSDQLHPYGPHIERELIETGHSEVVVRWRGLPGWTASAMAEYLDDGSVGLNPVLDGIQDPSLSLVILLAGTNDIGALTSSLVGGGGVGVDATSAVEPILKLHASCHERDIPTIAVGIPGSGWQEMNADASTLCISMNELLQEFAAGRERVTYVGFPFPYQRGDAKWCADGLHLSPEGYATLGKALSPSVRQVLEG